MIGFGRHAAARESARVPELDEAPAAALRMDPAIATAVGVGSASGAATVWTCDLTHGYISIDADD